MNERGKENKIKREAERDPHFSFQPADSMPQDQTIRPDGFGRLSQLRAWKMMGGWWGGIGGGKRNSIGVNNSSTKRQRIQRWQNHSWSGWFVRLLRALCGFGLDWGLFTVTTQTPKYGPSLGVNSQVEGEGRRWLTDRRPDGTTEFLFLRKPSALGFCVLHPNPTGLALKHRLPLPPSLPSPLSLLLCLSFSPPPLSLKLCASASN